MHHLSSYIRLSIIFVVAWRAETSFTVCYQVCQSRFQRNQYSSAGDIS